VVGLLLTEILAPATAEPLVSAYARVVRTGEPLVLDGQSLVSAVSGGVARMFDMRATAVEGLVAVVWRDVTDRVQAARRIADAQELFQLVAENASDVVVRVGADGKALWVSPAIRASLGWEPEELVGTSLMEIIHPKDAEQARQTRTRLLAGEPIEHPQDPPATRWRARDGSYRWMIANARPLADRGGIPAGLVYGLTGVDQLVHARQRALESEARVQLLLDTMAEGVMVFAPDGRVLQANPAAARIVGMDPQVMVGKHLESDRFRLVHADGSPMPMSQSPVPMCLASGQPVRNAIVGMYRPDGKLIWIESGVEPLRGPDGTTVGAVTTFADITAKVAAETELRESESRYRMLAERGTDVVFRGSPQAVMEWVSPSAAKVLGRDPTEMVGQPIANFIHPDDLTSMRAASQSANTGRMVKYRARIQHGDGGWRWLEVAAEPLLNDLGEVTGRIGSARDVTAQVAAEQALESSEELFRTALESASVGVCLIAPAGAVLRVNPALCELLGLDEESLLGSNWQDWRQAPTAAHVDAEPGLIAGLNSGERDSYRILKGFIRPDGLTVWADMSVGAVRNQDGRVRHLVAQLVDVTAQHDQQVELAAERARMAATLDSELDPHVTMTAVRDRTGRIVDFTFSAANAAALRYLGRTGEQVAATTMLGMFPSAAGTALFDMYAAVVDTGVPLVADDIAHPDGMFAGAADGTTCAGSASGMH
jgi:PAS domain S-box-containing protein